MHRWYKQSSAAYLSQWVFIDGNNRPQAVELCLRDSLDGVHKFVAEGAALVADNWHELRFPLSSFDLYDLQIAGIAFKQRGGGNIYWDCTSLVVDGKKFVLFENDLGDGYGSGNWQWSDDTVKFSRRSHSMPRPEFRKELVEHAVTFKQPVSFKHAFTEELPDFTKPAGQLVDEQFLAVANRALPNMAMTPFAYALYMRCHDILQANKEALTKLRLSILQQAESVDAQEWLEKFEQLEYEEGNANAKGTIESLVRTSRLPVEILQELNKSSAPQFLQDWQVVGPFATTGSSQGDFALENEGVNLNKTFETVGGKVTWKPYKTSTGRVDLRALFPQTKPGVAYAACWMFAERKKKMVLNVSTDDRIQIWLNPGGAYSTIALDEPFFRKSGQFRKDAKVEVCVRLEFGAGPD